MGVKEIPARYEYICDKCGCNEVSGTQKQRPSGWSRFILERGAQDYQGAEVADASVRRLFCSNCAQALVILMNNWAKEDQP